MKFLETNSMKMMFSLVTIVLTVVTGTKSIDVDYEYIEKFMDEIVGGFTGFMRDHTIRYNKKWDDILIILKSDIGTYEDIDGAADFETLYTTIAGESGNENPV